MNENTSTEIHDMLGSIIDTMEPLAASLTQQLGPIQEQTRDIRTTLTDSGALQPLPTDPSYLSIAAVDGAYTTSRLSIGDQTNVLAVAIRSDLDTRAVNIMGYHPDSQFMPHSPYTDLYAQVAMLSAELTLLDETTGDDVISIIDGSHLGAATTILEALTYEEGNPAHDLVTNQAETILPALANMAASETILACPKIDSSTELHDHLAQHGYTLPTRFPDKVLASLILEPGESLNLPACQPPWERFEATAHHVVSETGRPIRDRIIDILTPLKTDHGLTITHTKPHYSPTSLRIETKATVDPFEATDYHQAITEDCLAPHTQEPVAQYIADTLAKNVSNIATAQLETARLDLAQNPNINPAVLELFTRNYRTN